MKRHAELQRLEITVLAEDSVEYESPLLGQHGISFFVHARGSGAERTFIVDVGQNSNALFYNMEKLGLPPTAVDTVVLTHCHYDHTQGLAAFLKATQKHGVPIVAHPDLFRLHFITDPYLRHVGVMDEDVREKVERSGGKFFLTRDPLQLMPGLFTSGEVKRETEFETAGIALSTIVDGRIKADQVLDDLSVIARVAGKGCVIITGCSHAGIVNIVQHAMSLVGTRKIAGIIGGFHLVEASDERIKRTVRALSEFDIGWIAAGHCTGFRAQIALFSQYGDTFTPLHTGMSFTI